MLPEGGTTDRSGPFAVRVLMLLLEKVRTVHEHAAQRLFKRDHGQKKAATKRTANIASPDGDESKN